MYLAMALAVAGCAASEHGRRTTLILLAAGLLQCADAAPLWAEVERSLHTFADGPVDAGAWEAAISRHGFARVTPVLGCFRNFTPSLGRVLTQIQLIAGRLNVATNTVYSARPGGDCAPVDRVPEPGELWLCWLGGPAQPQPGSPCTTADQVAVCGMTLDAADRAALPPRGILR